LGHRFVGGRDTQDFGHAFSNYTYSRPYGRVWFSSVQRAHRIAASGKKEEEEEKSLVKYKSADMYVGSPNNNNTKIYNTHLVKHEA